MKYTYCTKNKAEKVAKGDRKHLFFRFSFFISAFCAKKEQIFLKTARLVTFCSNLCYIIIVTAKFGKGVVL